MDLKKLITGLLEKIDGSVAGFLCGIDGIGVDNVVFAPGIDITPTEVEITTVLKTVNVAAANLRAGAVSRLAIETERLSIIIEQFSDDFFLCVLLKPNGNVGRGKMELKRMSEQLRREL